MNLLKISITAAAVLSAITCGSAAAAMDLTPSGPFDPVKDRARVVYCIQAHLTPLSFAIETLGMDEQRMMQNDEVVIRPRFERLKPFMEAIDAREPKTEGGLAGEAGRGALAYTGRWEARAREPGSAEAILSEMMAESEKCDALVKSWGAPPA